MTVVLEYNMRAHKRTIYTHKCAWVAPLAIAIGTKTVLQVDDYIDIHMRDMTDSYAVYMAHTCCQLTYTHTHTHPQHTHTHTS